MPWVRPYVRKDGTAVRGYSRWASGARREMAILATVAVVVVGGGNAMDGSGKASGSEHRPRPNPTAVYPVRFPGWHQKPLPKPTVTYPIRFSPRGGQ